MFAPLVLPSRARPMPAGREIAHLLAALIALMGKVPIRTQGEKSVPHISSQEEGAEEGTKDPAYSDSGSQFLGGVQGVLTTQGLGKSLQEKSWQEPAWGGGETGHLGSFSGLLHLPKKL